MAEKTLQLKIITALQDKLSGPLKKIMGASGASASSIKDLRDKLKGLQQTQRQVGQFRDLHGGLQKTAEAMRQAQVKTNDLAQRLQATAAPSAALKREFDQASAASKRLKEEHSQQSAKLQGLRDKLHTAGISTKSLGADERQLRERISSTNQALEKQKSALGKVAEQQRKLSAAREKYQQTTTVASNLAVSGAAGYMTGRRALGGMTGFMQEGMDFDKEMSKVQALTRLDKNSDQMQALRDQARQLGATTAFTSTDAAAGQAFLGMAGFTPEAIKAAMPGVLDMALAGDMDLATTADISSNILTGMGLQADQMGRVADVMTGAFTRSNTDIRMLGETMKYAAPVAAQFGVDLETATAMAAKLGDAGIQGSMGGTGIRRIIGRLAAPNKAAREALEDLGVQVADSEGKMRPMTDLLAEIYEKSSRLTEIEQGQIFKAISGEQGVAAMGVLTKTAGEGTLQELQQQLYESAGEASKNASARMDNALGDIELLKSAWADVSIEVFSQNNDAIREIIQTVTSVTSAVGAWAQANPALVATLIKVAAVLAVLATGLGGLAITVAGILGPFAMMRYAFTLAGIKGAGLGSVMGNLGRTVLPMVGRALAFIGRAAMANPIGLAITVIAGGALLIYRYWEPIKEFFGGLWNQIKVAFDGGISGVMALLANWSPIGLVYQAFAAVLTYFGVDLPANLTGAVGLMWDSIAGKFAGGLANITQAVAAWSPLQIFTTAFDGVIQYLGVELPAKFMEFGTMIIQGLINGIRSMGGAVKDAVITTASSAMGWFAEKLGIESPSRVFMQMGGFVSEGAAIGIRNRMPMVEKAAQVMAAGVMAAGALAPVNAQIIQPPAIAFDVRPPITAALGNVAGAGQAGTWAAPAAASRPLAGDHIEINIHAAPGMDPQELARAVSRELDRRDREKRARARSSLSDYGN